MTAFVDLNIPIYATGAPHPYQEPCDEIIALAPLYPGAMLTDAETLQELFHVYMRREGVERARQALTYFRTALFDNVADMTLADIDFAASLDLPDRVDSRDRVHAAVMKRLGITDIISTDRGFEMVPGVRRLDPLRFEEWRGEVFGEG